MSGYYNVTDRFLGRVPEGLLSAIYAKVHSGILAADIRRRQGIRDGEYTYHTAHELYGYERRSRVETILQELRNEFGGVEVASASNRRGSYHTLIMLGKEKMLLTASAIPQPRQMVRSAKFRKKYVAMAVGNTDALQTSFKVEGGELEVEEFDRTAIDQGWIYGIILYSPSRTRRYLPGAVDIGFPHRLSTTYAGYIELKPAELRPAPAEPVVTVEKEPIPDLAVVSLLLEDVGVTLELEGGEIT